MTTAGSIVVDLLMRTGSFETDTARAEKRMKALAQEFDRSAALIGTAMIGATVAVAAWAKSSIDAADAASKQAQSAGLLVEEYNALAYAAGLSDVGQDELAAGLTRLAKKAEDAASGSKEASQSFKQLGVDILTPSGAIKSTDELLGDLAARFALMPDGVEKTAAAVDIFGKSGARLIPLLNGGRDGLEALKREAAALGLVISGDTAKAAEEFNDNLTRLAELARGAGNDLAAQLLPTLVDMSALLVDVGKESRQTGDGLDLAKLAADGFSTTAQALLVLLSDVGFVLRGTGREIGGWAAQIAAAVDLLATPPWDTPGQAAAWQRFTAISDAVTEDAERARKVLDEFQARVMGAGRQTAQVLDSWGREADPDRVPRFRPAGREGEAARKKAEAARERELDRLREFVEEQRKLALIVSDFGSTQSEAETARLARLEEQLASRRDQPVLQFNDVLDDLAAYKEELAEMPELIEPVTLAQQQMVEAFHRSEKAAYDIDFQPLIEQIEKVDDRTKRFLDNVQDGFGETLYSTLKGDFDSILDLWTDMLVRMVAEAAAADLAAALGFDGAKGGNLDQLLSTVVGFFTGGGRAGGGPVQRGGLYPINELGGPGEVLEVDDRQYLLATRPGSITPITANLPSFYAGRGGGAAGMHITVENLEGQSASATRVSPRSDGGIDVRLVVRQVMREDVANKGPISRDLAGTFGLNRASGAPRRG